MTTSWKTAVLWRALLAVWLWSLAGGVASAATMVRDLPPGLQIPAAAQPGPGFDVDRATEAYLNLLSPEQRALSDRYFEGGYWLQLWGLLWTVGACVLLLASGASRRMRDWARRRSRFRWIVTALYVAQFLVAMFVLGFPMTYYAEFLREHRYGLSEQAFGGWMRDQLVSLGVTVVLGTAALTVVYAAVRRTGARWWAWATGLSFAFLLMLSLIEPVYILPLFNDYKPLPEGPVREAVLALARANQVPTARLEWFDASRQTTRISANVAGFLGTTRIALNDNLLDKTSLPEIKAVLGHEMGHYVLNHEWKGPILQALWIGLALALLGWSLDRALARWGGRLGLGDRADPAALPLATALVSVIFYLLTPLQNSIVRSFEIEADAFGLNASREPLGFAMVAMRLSTYRKIKPGRLEEWVFYDHPSGYERVHAAMVWLKENQAAVAGETGATR
ncbi:MAG: M48 family metallopeptidase [Nevskia sp.]|nr:M48 family metallopeptidase [Nevskia sp.]